MADITSHPFSAVIKGGLRSIAASFPVLSSLGQLWNEYETYRTGGRIEELFKNLSDELLALKVNVDEMKDSFQMSQDVPELLELTIEKVRKEFDESKRMKYARLLAKLTVEGDQRTHDEKVTILDSLESLSELDLKVLYLFKNKSETSVGNLGWQTIGLSGDDNQKLWQLACSLARLESRGLILKLSTTTGVIYVPSGLNPNTARWKETKYILLPLGDKLIQVLFG